MTSKKSQSKKSSITVSVDKSGVPISPTMWGIFFEDINFGADGGLYPELVKNRSFEFPDNMMGWQRILEPGSAGYLYIEKHPGNPVNAHYLRMEIQEIGHGFGISNEGFRGMGIRQDKDYRFSFQARQSGGEPITLRVEVVTSDGRKIMEDRITGFNSDWQTYTTLLTATATEPKARLNLFVEKGNGILDIDLVSLFPMNTFKGRENGLRADLVAMLADLKPGFLRFPGGCIVEGRTLAQRYRWKDTIGNLAERKLNINRWNTEFGHRLTPDYYQSFGLGFYEYFLLAEDIGAEPMPIINCGMACQFNTGELVPIDELEPYVQDALDLLEFAKSPTDTKWGKVRADMGHPEPFDMKMIGIGNEQWGPQYIERYKVLAEAIKSKYPEIQLIAATGSDATIFLNGQKEIDYLWSQWRQLKPEFVDEHFYRKPEWFVENVNLYDNYERKGPKLFVGEYAAQSEGVAIPDNRNNWKCALYEAAFITGMERNADIIRMTCYAPLFGHEEAWQWRPNLIWFDNLNVYGSANYYVQKLFSLNPGTNLLSAQANNVPNLNDKSKALTVSSTFDEKTGEVIIKAVNVSSQALEANIELKDITKAGPQAKVITLTSDNLTNENSLQEPKKIYPVENSISVSSTKFSYNFVQYSFTILRVPIGK